VNRLAPGVLKRGGPGFPQPLAVLDRDLESFWVSGYALMDSEEVMAPIRGEVARRAKVTVTTAVEVGRQAVRRDIHAALS